THTPPGAHAAELRASAWGGSVGAGASVPRVARVCVVCTIVSIANVTFGLRRSCVRLCVSRAWPVRVGRTRFTLRRKKRLINDVGNAQNPRHYWLLAYFNEVYIMHVIGRYTCETNVRFFVRGFSVGASLLRGSCARLSRVQERSGRRLAARLG